MLTQRGAARHRHSLKVEDEGLLISLFFFCFFRCLGGCDFLDPFCDFPSITDNVMLTQRGAAPAVHRRHGLKVEDKGLLISLFFVLFF
jgi:hypothetical protein